MGYNIETILSLMKTDNEDIIIDVESKDEDDGQLKEQLGGCVKKRMAEYAVLFICFKC